MGRVEEDCGIDTGRLRLLARRLERTSPPERWWPYDDPFAIAVSALLAQQTRWSAVEVAMENLRRAGLLEPRPLAYAARRAVERLVRPTGFYQQKARAVQAMARVVCDRYGGDFSKVIERPTAELRQELLSWRGVGNETADSILLYAARRPAFVVDAYAIRLMERFGALRLDARPRYEEVAAAWRDLTPRSVRRYHEIHGAIVDLCKAYCRTIPDCASCPLRQACPKIGVRVIGITAARSLENIAARTPVHRARRARRARGML